jgi:hypothetical protein
LLAQSAGLASSVSFLEISRTPNKIGAIVRPFDARRLVHTALPPAANQLGNEFTGPVPLLFAWVIVASLSRRDIHSPLCTRRRATL